jgi:hypothetical protein
MRTPMTDSDSQWPADIKTPDRKLRVFVSSTLGEPETEWKTARAAIEQLQLALALLKFGARPHVARAVYRAYIEQSEVFIGIYCQRYGWTGPDITV